MGIAITIAALVLAAVFATAGIAKLVDLEGSRRAVAAFGVPRRLASSLGTLLPAGELVTGALLVAGTARGGGVLVAGALVALALLAVFCVGIALSLARGRAPDCHCFGQLHSAPAGLRTLARNGALLALAAFVASGGDPLPTVAAGLAAFAMLALVTFLFRRRPAEPAERTAMEGLPVGAQAAGFQLPDLAGEVHTLDSLRAEGLPVLLLFTDPHCGPCIELAPEVARWQRDHSDDLVIAVIEQRSRNGDRPAAADEHGRANVLLQRDGEVADRYRAQGTPTAVLIGSDGAIASPVAAGGGQIEALMDRTVDGFEPRQPYEPPVRSVLTSRYRRRELLARGAGAWAAMTAVLAWPLRGVAVGSGRQRRSAERCRDRSDCPGSNVRCRDGRCRCKKGYTRCGSDGCVNLQEGNRHHCGGCRRSCDGRGLRHPRCCEGKCVEARGNRCNCGNSGRCSDNSICVYIIGSDPADYECIDCSNFGGRRRCGDDCGDPETERCCGDRLYNRMDLGPGDWRCCGPKGNRRLVNVQESEAHCGVCDRSCPRDKPICYRGRCRKRCPRRRRRCGDTCGNPRKQLCCKGKLISKDDSKSDPKNCGQCGRKCNGPFDTGECCNGKCCNINADTCCPGGCKNLQHDDENCGGCGNVCRSGEYCRFGSCTQPPS